MYFSGCLVMGVGAMVFVLPHFMSTPFPGSTFVPAAERNLSDQNICRAQVREQLDEFDRSLGRLSPGKFHFHQR
jgi:hypothetical protein